LERGAFVVSVERAAGVVRERENFFFRDAEFAADRSVDVLSKLAPVERGDAAIDEACNSPSINPDASMPLHMARTPRKIVGRRA